MRFLVTGGAGFIGSHITGRLLKEGNFVRVLDNFSTGKEENLDFTGEFKGKNKFELIRADIRDKQACFAACDGIDYIFHEAALRSVPKSLEIPYEFNAVNIDGTLNLLEAAKKYKIKRFVFASSSSIYGETDKFPEQETDYTQLISPYALSKLAGEMYCRVYSFNYGLPTVSLRYFNVFGPRQAIDDEYAVVIPKFIDCMLKGQQPPVHGDGKQSRDFTFIDNVVEANILSAKTPGINCEVFNVANGKDNSVLELVSSINDILGSCIEPDFTPPRPGDVMRTLADISKIKKMLKFSPKVDFKAGLKTTVEWFKNREESHAHASRQQNAS